MKIEAHPIIHPRRGGPVEEGNVYSNPHGRPHYKIVLGKMVRDKDDRPWKNVVILKVYADGSLAGASCEPEAYVRDHQDLVGRVKEMPDLKIVWLGQETK